MTVRLREIKGGWDVSFCELEKGDMSGIEGERGSMREMR